MNDQLALFGKLPDKIDPKARPPTKDRAGTSLDPRWSHVIKIGPKVHGLFDERHRIYQTGGELSNFVYWKLHLVSFDARVWMQVKDKVDWIEVLDHQRNECWRIAMGKAVKNLVTYQGGIGTRVGIPMRFWDVIRLDGSYKQVGEV